MKLPSLILGSLALLSHPAWAALTAVYNFNESNGNTAADSIRGAGGAGTLSNGFSGSQWVPGKIGNALEFDGVNDFVLAPNAVPTGTTALTISAWVWVDSRPTWGTIVKNWGPSLTGSFHFGLDGSSGRLSNYLAAPQTGPAIAPAQITLGVWHHVAVTYTGGVSASQSLYLDGVLVGSSAAPTDLDALGVNMGIGVKTDNATLVPDTATPGYWDGKIDDLAFWNEALTATQILQIKNNGDLGIGVGVPEPSSLAFAMLGAACLIRRRR